MQARLGWHQQQSEQVLEGYQVVVRAELEGLLAQASAKHDAHLQALGDEATARRREAELEAQRQEEALRVLQGELAVEAASRGAERLGYAALQRELEGAEARLREIAELHGAMTEELADARREVC